MLALALVLAKSPEVVKWVAGGLGLRGRSSVNLLVHVTSYFTSLFLVEVGTGNRSSKVKLPVTSYWLYVTGYV